MSDGVAKMDRHIEQLNSVIAGVEGAGLLESAALLKIARLHLVMRANGFSEEELDVILNGIRRDQFDMGDLDLTVHQLDGDGAASGRC